MNFPTRILFLMGLACLFPGLARAQAMPDQPQVSFTGSAEGVWIGEFEGLVGRSYFMVGSTDLVNWTYLPDIKFGEGIHTASGANTNVPKYFFRLKYTDEPTTDPELEDFADDGIGSMLKLLMGLDPFVPLAWEDTDSDGIHDAVERFWFSDSLTGTEGGDDDANGNGIRDVFEIQAGTNPTVDLTTDAGKRSNYSYDVMGRLIHVDDGSDGQDFAFDTEGNLESATSSNP